MQEAAVNRPMVDAVFGQFLQELLESHLKSGQAGVAAQVTLVVTAARFLWAALVEIMEYAQ
jgi:hypothetical protein